ncbi:two-component sensor histidine kinase [Rhodococcus hoagii]|jgi:two-component system sensor histidine kinase PrrB|uniref:histidine kinase n=4 Tax=Rhodococcus hoagii TaxID=43767 RepID=A0AAE2W3Z6_RHOHA|nr:HAMP domain-containing sensor histidine kinase [Prescottella equi]AVP67513.1 sensor histidine kinase [Prescottella equi]MBM4468000.1 two-component sensor histidine kinase [Prescottella equi]MBM4476099.1 two-component sensor histidine kinase [Prescottella equi]MBM4477172.1 two-component sensor histidine kinase [Prescottella equi]MBM4482547.1 two-component sensor histidine kinase [Prescottella equi]
MRPQSLRARVAAATALGATIVVAAVGVYLALAIARNNLQQLDRRLETASRVLVVNAGAAAPFLNVLGDGGAFAVTIRAGEKVVSSTSSRLPELDPGSHTVDVAGTPFRTFTAPLGPDSTTLLTVAVPLAEAKDPTTDQQQQVALVGVGAIVAATGLGWLFGGRAVRPLVELTQRVGRRDRDLATAASGVREADELAAAAGAMLQDVSDAQERTAAALDTARDFAAASAHELRTPLTAMRTDLEVLTTLDLSDEQRAEILADLARTQGRLEATLTALERLASGELSSEKDHVDLDLTELCDLAAEDAQRLRPDLTVTVDAPPGLVVRGLPVGLRLSIDNAISNAVRHGGARHVSIGAHRNDDGTVTVTVDDDGTGIPHEERVEVFERFRRGSSAAKGGSGLGLALVAQQAGLHGGTAHLADSPLGGARLVVTLES